MSMRRLSCLSRVTLACRVDGREYTIPPLLVAAAAVGATALTLSTVHALCRWTQSRATLLIASLHNLLGLRRAHLKATRSTLSVLKLVTQSHGSALSEIGVDVGGTLAKIVIADSLAPLLPTKFGDGETSANGTPGGRTHHDLRLRICRKARRRRDGDALLPADACTLQFLSGQSAQLEDLLASTASIVDSPSTRSGRWSWRSHAPHAFSAPSAATFSSAAAAEASVSSLSAAAPPSLDSAAPRGDPTAVGAAGELAAASSSEVRRVAATGGGAHKLLAWSRQSRVTRALQLVDLVPEFDFHIVPEMEAAIEGLLALHALQPPGELFRIAEDDSYRPTSWPQRLFPFLLVSMGSGVSVLRVEGVREEDGSLISSPMAVSTPAPTAASGLTRGPTGSSKALRASARAAGSSQAPPTTPLPSTPLHSPAAARAPPPSTVSASTSGGAASPPDSIGGRQAAPASSGSAPQTPASTHGSSIVYRRVGGTACGGATFLGLAKLLTRRPDMSFEEALQLASMGDSRGVDKVVGDIYGEAGSVALGLPAALTAASFGKLVNPPPPDARVSPPPSLSPSRIGSRQSSPKMQRTSRTHIASSPLGDSAAPSTAAPHPTLSGAAPPLPGRAHTAPARAQADPPAASRRCAWPPSDADVISALLDMVVQSSAVLAKAHASRTEHAAGEPPDAPQIQCVFFCGGFVSANPLARAALARSLRALGLEALFFRRSEFLGALGALVREWPGGAAAFRKEWQMAPPEARLSTDDGVGVDLEAAILPQLLPNAPPEAAV